MPLYVKSSSATHLRLEEQKTTNDKPTAQCTRHAQNADTTRNMQFVTLLLCTYRRSSNQHGLPATSTRTSSQNIYVFLLKSRHNKTNAYSTVSKLSSRNERKRTAHRRSAYPGPRIRPRESAGLDPAADSTRPRR